MLKRITHIITAIFTIAAIALLFFLYRENPDEFPWKNALLFVLFTALFAAIATQVLVRVVKIIVNEMWAFRLAVVISGIYFLLCIVFIEPLSYSELFGGYTNMSDFISISVIPLVVFWGAVWVLKSKKNL